MSNQTEALEQASIRQYCKLVRMPAIAANFMPLAEQAIKEQHSHVRFLMKDPRALENPRP